MANFESGETVILQATVKLSVDDSLHDPSTTMRIDILDPSDVAVVTAQNMVRDSAGVYHYDYLAPATKGPYTVVYTATDGSRVTKQRDSFNVQA